MILCLARLSEIVYDKLDTYRMVFLFAGVTIPIFIPVVSANLSSGIIIAGIAVSMTFVVSKKRWIFCAGIGGGMGLIVLLYQSGILEKVLDAYQMARIYAWFDPEAYASTNGFQVLQGLYAIGAGSLFGRGLGESIQKMGYLPEAQNDMIFSLFVKN